MPPMLMMVAKRTDDGINVTVITQETVLGDTTQTNSVVEMS